VARSGGTVHDKVKAFALSLPGAYEDHPWGETVVKVNRKVFVFLGHEETRAERGMSVKLTDSHAQALMVAGARPTGYGLGRAGWVDVPLRKGPPLPVLRDWVEESYRIVAPKKLVAELDTRR
jgi:predicted DNA-binding protein (MmcQ/YjbR family)